VTTAEHVDVLIIGAGLSGIGAAAHLAKDLPDTSYAVLERREVSGGTWDLFRYPGVRSDSDMHTLGYRFRPWRGDTALADGESILDYLRETAREHDVERHVRYGHRVVAADWDSSADGSVKLFIWVDETANHLEASDASGGHRLSLGTHQPGAGYLSDHSALGEHPASEIRDELARVALARAHTPTNRLAALASLVRGLDAGSQSRLLELASGLEDGPVLAAALQSLAGRPQLMRHVARGLVVYPKVIETAVMAELPFMATEEILMAAVRAGGDRQELHECIRRHSLAAAEAVKMHGRANDLLDLRLAKV